MSPFSQMGGVTSETSMREVSSEDIRSLINYHWLDSTKKDQDYHRLERLYSYLIPRLTESLNSLHVTSHSSRYWEIICGAWLLSHIAVVFDRWEISRSSTEIDSERERGAYLAERVPTLSGYREYALSASHSLDFNSQLLRATSIYQAGGRFLLAPETAEQQVRDTINSGTYGWKLSLGHWRHGLVSSAKDIVLGIYGRVARKLLSNNEIVFVSTYIKRRALVRLQLQLAQLPLLDFPFRDLHLSNDLQASWQMRDSLRSCLLKNSKFPTGSFEAFLLHTIATYMPRSAVESYEALCGWSYSLGTQARIIVTSNAHFGDEHFKNWAAGMTESGARLIICEHGGSFPLRNYLFGFEDRIADVRVQTMPLSGEKYQRVRAPSYLGSKGQLKCKQIATKTFSFRRSRDLLVIPYQGSQFALRADSQPASIQWLQAAWQSVSLLRSLDKALLSRVVLKAHPGAMPRSDSAETIKVASGTEVRVSRRTLRSSLWKAHFIVCTYPQTTFAESMLSGRPVILLYNADLHGIHPQTESLMLQLEQAQIAFQDSERAAQHLNRFFFDPRDWWESSLCLDARKAFLETLYCSAGSGLGPWKQMLRKQLSLAHREAKL